MREGKVVHEGLEDGQLRLEGLRIARAQGRAVRGVVMCLESVGGERREPRRAAAVHGGETKAWVGAVCTGRLLYTRRPFVCCRVQVQAQVQVQDDVGSSSMRLKLPMPRVRGRSADAVQLGKAQPCNNECFSKVQQDSTFDTPQCPCALVPPGCRLHASI